MRVLPCSAMPFMAAAIACSRMPKWIVRPYGSASGSGLPAGRNDDVLSIVVLFEPARSAELPHSSGTISPSAWSTLPEAARVARPLPGSKTGASPPSPRAARPRRSGRRRRRAPELAVRHAANDLSHSARASRPRSRASRVWPMTSSETSKVCSGSKPRTRLVAATSSSPSAEPCAASVFCAFGAGQAMIERAAMNEGARSRPGRLQRRVQTRRVQVAARQLVDTLHVPAVRLVPLDGVLGDRGLRVALDGDVVVVPEQDQVAQLLVPGQRGRLGRDALLEAAVTRDDPHHVVERGGAGAASGSNRPRSVAGGHRHAHRVGDTLAQWAGRRLDTGGVAVLRVARGLRAPGAEGLQARPAPGRSRRGRAGCRGSGWSGRRRGRTGRGRSTRRPRGRAASPSGRGCTRQARGSWPCRVAVSDFLYGVRGENTGGVHGPLVHIGPLEVCGGRLDAHPESGLLSTVVNR